MYTHVATLLHRGWWPYLLNLMLPVLVLLEQSRLIALKHLRHHIMVACAQLPCQQIPGTLTLLNLMLPVLVLLEQSRLIALKHLRHHIMVACAQLPCQQIPGTTYTVTAYSSSDRYCKISTVG